mgnify:CR=1 FL=1
MSDRRIRIGIDVGGTFTKAIALDIVTGEILSTSTIPTTHTAQRGVSVGIVSVLTDLLKGKDLSFTKKVTDDFLNMLKTKSKITLNSLSEDQITTINSLSGVQEFPMRIKCATMAWHALLSAIEKKEV